MRFGLKHTLRCVVVVLIANITLRRGVIWDLAFKAHRKFFKAHGKIWNHTRRSRALWKIFRALWKPNLKSHLSAGWCLRLTPRPPRAECALNQSAQKKLCALGFSVRFGLKHTLRCVIWVKSWKLEALIWAESGVMLEITQTLILILILIFLFSK